MTLHRGIREFVYGSTVAGIGEVFEFSILHRKVASTLDRKIRLLGLPDADPERTKSSLVPNWK